MDSRDFVFVYDKRLAKYLKLELGINYITNARHKVTGNEFWLFPKSNKVKMSIGVWKEIMNK